MDLRSLRYFVAAAETQNLSRAAEGLNIVQSALSHQIRLLEQDLGVALFERHGRRVKLSPVGAVFLEEARHILQEVQRARHRVERASAGHAGTLRVGFQSVACRNRLLSEALLLFRELYPEVQLTLSPMTASAMLDHLLEGDLDAGFLHLPVRPAELEAFCFDRNDWLLALPRNHRLAAAPRLRLADLAGEPFIWLPRQVAPVLNDRMLALCADGGLVPHIVQEAFDEVIMVNLVSVGMGLCFVIDSAPAIWPADMVTFRKVDDFSLPLEMCFAWRRDNGFAPLKRLTEIIGDHKSSRPGRAPTRT
jgi:DNA-binding transcriptional LysR family regulator